ncbi:MAG: HYR domain-containing protein, partial [Saprospiraceae bacterium]|nr:HYR domain-containing protein [Saprospiraceae bacterium]
VILEVEDASGNISQCTTYVLVLDTNVPLLTCPNDVYTGTDLGLCSAELTGLAPQFTLDNCPAEVTYTIAGATIASGNDDVSGTVFEEGISTVTYTITDESGNHSHCSFSVFVTDDEDPQIDCSNIDPIVSNDAGECDYTVAGTEFDPASYTDNCPGVSLTNDYNYTGTLAGEVFPVGTTTVVWTATDATGNTASCTIDYVVEDTEQPSLDCAPIATDLTA